MIRPKHNLETGEFQGLYENVGFMIVRRSPDEVFFNYRYDKDKSKVLYSHYTQNQFDDWAGCSFNRTKLDLFGADKAVMSTAVTQCLRNINDISN